MKYKWGHSNIHVFKKYHSMFTGWKGINCFIIIVYLFPNNIKWINVELSTLYHFFIVNKLERDSK